MLNDALRQHVAVVLPSTKEVDKPLPPDEREREFASLRNFLTWWFGGVTIIPAVGGYLSHSKAVVTENTSVFIAFAGDLDDVDVEVVLLYAKGIKNRLSQESVSVLVNGGLVFVS